MRNELTAYPLCWPAGWPRTNKAFTVDSRFRITQETAQRNLFHQIDLLGGTDTILSTNIRLRQDGLPYASQRPPEDRGVAVYFEYCGKQMSFACDRFNQVGDNIHAIGKTIEALRGIDRWGASDMMERAFTGFAALPPGTGNKRNWWEVLHVHKGAPYGVVDKAYKNLRSQYHPDKPAGDKDKFHEVTQAFIDYEAICLSSVGL